MAQERGVLVKISPVSGLYRRYLKASIPFLSHPLGLMAVPPRRLVSSVFPISPHTATAGARLGR